MSGLFLGIQWKINAMYSIWKIWHLSQLMKSLLTLEMEFVVSLADKIVKKSMENMF